MSRSSQNPLTVVSNTDELTTQEYYELFTAEHRRLAFDLLAEQTGPVELEELAGEIAVRADDIDVDNRSAVDRVAITLHHVHLPKMAELELIEYDTESSVVERL